MNLSVIIPAYNEEKNLPKIIGALRNQTRKDFEIIVIDNNSKDKTFNIAKKLSDKVYKCREQGLSPARNYGAKMAKTEVIAFLDADTIPSPRWAETILESFEKDKNLSAISGINVYEHDNLFKWLIINLFSNIFFYLCKILVFFGQPKVIAPNIAIKKDILMNVGGFDDVIGEDHYLSLKLKKLGNVKCRIDRLMKLECSSRRMRKLGIIKTHWIWFKAVIKREEFKNYDFHDEI